MYGGGYGPAPGGLFAVVMEAYLHGTFTRKVDDLVKALVRIRGFPKARSRGFVTTSTPRSPHSGIALG